MKSKICKIEGCGRKIYRYKDVCPMHKKRFLRNGSFDIVPWETEILVKQGKAKCSKCKQIKDLSEFNNSQVTLNGKSHVCRVCYRLERNKVYQIKKHIFALQSIFRRYKLTEEDLNNLYKIQNYKCAICGRDKPKDKNFAIDHNHRTGKVRGLLCSNCNLGIGHFNDDPKILENVICYLKKDINETISNSKEN